MSVQKQRFNVELLPKHALSSPVSFVSIFAVQEEMQDDEDLDEDSIVEWMCCQCAKFTVGSHRFDCTRCSHDMCPYCERKRRRDVHRKAPPSSTTPPTPSSPALHTKDHIA